MGASSQTDRLAEETQRAAVDARDEWFRAIIDSALDCIVTIDREGRIIEFNPAAEATFGFRRDEVMGRELVKTIVPHEQREAHLKGMQRYLDTGRPTLIGKRIEVKALCADGSEIPVELTVVPVRPSKEVVFTAYLRNISERRRAEEQRQESALRLRRALIQTINSVSTTVEKRDPYTAGHQRRVAQLAVEIGRRMKLSQERLVGLYLGGLIHDIGKVHLPLEILNRPGQLSSAEFELVKEHSAVGDDIVRHVDFPWPLNEIIVQHHERLDGSGYPKGLKGDEIVEEARIMAVADVFEAIVSHRPYRPALGFDVAVETIEKEAGKTLDADVVAICREIVLGSDFSFDDPEDLEAFLGTILVGDGD